jgi:chromosome partitioning protein
MPTQRKEEMAHMCTCANLKGGVGKSVLSMVLAGTLSTFGKKVLVVDADRQGTATQSARSAPEDRPFPATVIGLAHAQGKLHQLVRPMIDDYDYIIIDCPPSAHEPATQSALLISDVCLVPLQPTPADLWATQAMVELITRARGLNPTLKALAVANRVTRSTLAREVLAVAREGDIPLMDTTLGSRTSFQEATVRGSTPALMGAAHKVAAAEAQALTLELLERMAWH